LEAGKYVSNFKPVFFLIILKLFDTFFKSAQISWPLLHCQTIALQSGLPV
jgi:hypothetical protein